MTGTQEHFSAPWSRTVKIITGGLVVLGIVLATQVAAIAGVAILGVLALCAAFAVRGYSVIDGEILVHRLGWSTRFPVTQITRIDHSPGIMSGSIRTFGIGGAFGFIGHFHNAVLGSYRAYATDPANAVVLEFDDKKVVVTPDRPVEFVAAVEAMLESAD